MSDGLCRYRPIWHSKTWFFPSVIVYFTIKNILCHFREVLYLLGPVSVFIPDFSLKFNLLIGDSHNTNRIGAFKEVLKLE